MSVRRRHETSRSNCFQLHAPASTRHCWTFSPEGYLGTVLYVAGGLCEVAMMLIAKGMMTVAYWTSIMRTGTDMDVTDITS